MCIVHSKILPSYLSFERSLKLPLVYSFIACTLFGYILLVRSGTTYLSERLRTHHCEFALLVPFPLHYSRRIFRFIVLML